MLQALTPETAEAASVCIAESFAVPSDPFTWLFNLKRHHWLHMVIPFVERAAAAKRPLSTIALNEATGKVDGVMIAEDWTSPRPLAYRSALSSEWVPVRALFAELHTRYVAAARGVRGPIFAGDEVRCLYFTCVHPGARHQEVLKGLWRGTIDAARDNGYKTITAQASTDAVRAVLDKTLGFSEVRGARWRVRVGLQPSNPLPRHPHPAPSSRQVASVPFETWTVPPADAALAGCTPTLFADLAPRTSRLSIHKRAVPSNLY